MQHSTRPDQDLPTLAEQLIANGRYAQAIQVLQRHLSVAPTDRRARHLLGLAAFNAGDYGAAEQAFRALASLPNPNPRSLYSLGLALERQGRVQEARRWVGAAVAVDPTFTKAQDHLAKLSRAAPKRPPRVEPPRAAWNVPNLGARSGRVPPRRQRAREPSRLSELQIPSDRADLKKYEELRRAKARVDYKIDNWSAIPLGLRVLFIVFTLCLVVAMAFGVFTGMKGWQQSQNRLEDVQQQQCEFAIRQGLGRPPGC
jgi:cytochrome c-type biogenesis protein CcmH/NrfG